MKKIATVFLAAFVLCTACMDGGPRVKGNGNMTTESTQPGDFTSVELHSSFDVYLTEGSSAGVKIEAEQNILSHIEVHVEDGTLNIDTKDHVWLDPTLPVKIFVTAPSYKEIQNTGSGNITGQTKLSNETKLDISSSGSGTLQLDVDAPEINTSVSGSGSMNLTGQTKKFKGDVSGSGGIKAINLMTEESALQLSGSGNIEVYASVMLDASISGSGYVRYKGEAKVNTNISGSGYVKKVD
jgi:putative autotransporter adhesin-like protein